jgi:arylsulfatase
MPLLRNRDEAGAWLKEVGKAAQTMIDFPPMQKGASFNMEAVKQQIEKSIQSRHGN